MKFNLTKAIMRFGFLMMRLFSNKTKYSDWLDAPNHHRTLRWNRYPEEPDYYECCVLNSESPSDQVWLGRNDKWHVMYGGPEFRRMAIWVLWQWAWNDWFGLKTKLWLWGLTMHLHGQLFRETK